MTATPMDRLRAMSESERPTAPGITDALDELTDVREWAEAFTALADAIEELDGAKDTWAEAERADRPDARDDVLTALQTVADALTDLEALPPLDLGPEVTL